MVACGLLTACSDSPATAPSLADVRGLLSSHAKALRGGDRDGFLNAVSNSGTTATFRQLQADEFDNLQHVPLTSWSYAVSGAMTDSDLVHAADKKYGQRVLIVHVTLSYGLRRADPVPTQRDLYWTFGHRGGRVVIVGDDDATALDATSWHGPWDYGHLHVVQGARCLVLGHDADVQVLPGLAGEIDAAIPAVTAVWGTDWPQYVVAIVPGSQAEFDANSGAGPGLDSVAAFATTDGDDPVHNTRTGRRLLISPGELGRLSQVGQGIVLRHEITHLAAVNSTTESSPAWVVEGFAEYVANLSSGQPVGVAASELKAAVMHGQVPSGLPTGADFAGTQAPQAYEGAWLACRLIAARAGQAALVRFYKSVGAQLVIGDAAVAAGIRAVLHESLQSFTAQWQAYLLQVLR